MDLAVLFSAGIFLLSFLSLLLGGFTIMLKVVVAPIKKQLTEHAKDIDRLSAGQKRLEEGQRQLEAGQKRLEDKIDKLLRDRGK